MRKLKLIIAVAVMMALSVAVLTACGTNYAVSWTAPTGQTITATVDGSAIESGDEVREGSNIVFTVPAPTAGFQWRITAPGMTAVDLPVATLTWTLEDLDGAIAVTFALVEIPRAVTVTLAPADTTVAIYPAVPATLPHAATYLVVTLTGAANANITANEGGVWDPAANTVRFEFEAGHTALAFTITAAMPAANLRFVNVTSTLPTGVAIAPAVPATVAVTATELVVTLTGAANMSVVATEGGVWNPTAGTVTFTFDAGESALHFAITVTAPAATDRAVTVNLAGTAYGVAIAPAVPATIARTATYLVVTLTGIAADVTPTATGGGVWARAAGATATTGTIRFEFAAGEPALFFTITVDAERTLGVTLATGHVAGAAIYPAVPATIGQNVRTLVVNLTGIPVAVTPAAPNAVWERTNATATTGTMTFTLTPGTAALALVITAAAAA